jgi:hypothetical protein
VIAIISLICGFSVKSKNVPQSGDAFVTNPLLMPIVAILGILYCYVSFSFDLLNRRIGSEVIAEVYSNLPLWALAVLRVYELFLVPSLILLVFSKNKLTSFQYVVLLFISLVSIPFMGLSDSRGKLLIIVLSFIIFVRMEIIKSAFKSSFTLYVAIILTITAFTYASIDRASQYARSSDFYLSEVVERLDGLALLKDLNDVGIIKTFGNFDFEMFVPLKSKIPFLDEARYLKSIAKTSTKQYYLQDVLDTNKFDSNNSMIVDPIYFGGIPLLIIAFFGLGFLSKKFDIAISKESLFKSRIGTSYLFAFGMSFLLIESDFLGAISSFIQNFLLYYAALFVALRKSDGRSSSPSTMGIFAIRPKSTVATPGQSLAANSSELSL